jgi:hypothetical protein
MVEEENTLTTPPEEAQTEPKIDESMAEPKATENVPEIVAENTPETETAQMGGIEPLPPTPNEGAVATAEAPEEEHPTPAKEEHEVRKQEDKVTKNEPTQKEKLGLLRKMAHATILLRREKKLVKIMELFAKQTEITNDEVEKHLHVSDATATRYLAELEKRGKLTQHGTTGRGVSYTKR